MSSNIQVQRICEYCQNQFTARTTVTRFCSKQCASKASKARIRAAKVKMSNKQIKTALNVHIETVKAKEYLTVKDAALLLNCSARSIYRMIDSNTIKAVNLAERKTTIKRSDIDALFDNHKPKQNIRRIEPNQMDISDYYSMGEIQTKYGISEKALYEVIKRNKIQKHKDGRFVYVLKDNIDSIFN